MSLLQKVLAFCDAQKLRSKFARSVITHRGTLYSTTLFLKDDKNESENSSFSTFQNSKLGKTSKSRLKKSSSFSIDRSGFYGLDYSIDPLISAETTGNIPNVSIGNNNENLKNSKGNRVNNPNKEVLTPLGEDLQYYISMRGPISLHDYIGQTSNHSLYGYYHQSSNSLEKNDENLENDSIGSNDEINSNNNSNSTNKLKGTVIGKKGDFITSPEISQLFGECIGIWCISVWQQLGCPEQFNLIELGPGNGTLMKDILRVANRFPNFKKAISINFIELSESMRIKQRETLEINDIVENIVDKNEDSKVINYEYEEFLTKPTPSKKKQMMNHTSSNPSSNQSNTPKTNDSQTVSTTSSNNNNNNNNNDKKQNNTAQTNDGVLVTWYDFLQNVPQSETIPNIIIAQEFLDALPVHQFVYTKNGWREKLVDFDLDPNTKMNFRIVLSKSSTPASKTLLNLHEKDMKDFSNNNQEQDKQQQQSQLQLPKEKKLSEKIAERKKFAQWNQLKVGNDNVDTSSVSTVEDVTREQSDIKMGVELNINDNNVVDDLVSVPLVDDDKLKAKLSEGR